MNEEKGIDLKTDTRKALITQILAVMVTPLTVAVTLYLTDLFKKPSPRIEYVLTQTTNMPCEPPPSIAKNISERSRLSLMYHDELSKIFDENGRTMAYCTSWLNGGEWDATCMDAYKQVTAKIKHSLNVTLLDANARSQAPPVLAAVFPHKTDINTELKNINNISRDFMEFFNAPKPLSGSVLIKVGVMNTGDSDGVIFSNATLTFAGKTVHIMSDDGYKAVKAHSFEEVTFQTPCYIGEKIWNDHYNGEEESIKLLTEKIKSQSPVPFSIGIILSDKQTQYSGTL